jgi:hypothetical protein
MNKFVSVTVYGQQEKKRTEKNLEKQKERNQYRLYLSKASKVLVNGTLTVNDRKAMRRDGWFWKEFRKRKKVSSLA